MQREFAIQTQSYKAQGLEEEWKHCLPDFNQSIQKVNKFNSKAKTQVPCFESFVERNNMWEAQLKTTSCLSFNHWMQAIVNWGQLRFSSAASNHCRQRAHWAELMQARSSMSWSELHQLSSRSRDLYFLPHTDANLLSLHAPRCLAVVTWANYVHFTLFLSSSPLCWFHLGSSSSSRRTHVLLSRMQQQDHFMYCSQQFLLARSRISVTGSILG